MTIDLRQRAGGSLIRYRVMAFATGVMLLLSCLTWVLHHWVDDDSSTFESLNAKAWMIHGFLFLLYAIATLDLGTRVRWRFDRIVLIGVAGTVPTASFFAEHWVTKQIRLSSV